MGISDFSYEENVFAAHTHRAACLVSISILAFRVTTILPFLMDLRSEKLSSEIGAYSVSKVSRTMEALMAVVLPRGLALMATRNLVGA